MATTVSLFGVLLLLGVIVVGCCCGCCLSVVLVMVVVMCFFQFESVVSCTCVCCCWLLIVWCDSLFGHCCALFSVAVCNSFARVVWRLLRVVYCVW